jgi:putative transposase
MAFTNTIKNQSGVYFITFTAHQWVDVFTRRLYVDILLESLRYCQQNKGLEIFGWVIMSNHCHLIVRAINNNLSDIIRDFKKFTAKEIFKAIQNNPKESRREWLTFLLAKDDKIWFWEESYHGEEIFSKVFFDSKLNYIHLNPVRAGIVEKQEEYLLSSAGDYFGTRKGLLELSYFG